MDPKPQQLICIENPESPARALFDGSAVASLLLDEAGFLDCNQAALELWRIPDSRLIYRQPFGFLSAELQAAGNSPELARNYIDQALEKGSATFEWLYKRPDGTEFPGQTVFRRLLLDGKTVIQATVTDISLWRHVEQELSITRAAFELQEGILVTDRQGIIIRVNRVFTEISGFSIEELLGKTPKMFCSGHHNANFYKTLWSDLENKGNWQGEIWNRHKNGNIYAEWLSISPVKSPEGIITHYIGIYSDVNQYGDTEPKIYRLAYYDVLTNLPNRRLLFDRIEQAMIACKRTSLYGAIVYLDLDNFKALNDSRGHDVGDELLVEVAKRLQVAVREGDTVARIGGDEFVILLENLSEDIDTATHQARLITEKLLELMSSPYELQGLSFKSLCSFGVSLFNQHDQVPEEVLKRADLAMYEAKRDGGNDVYFFRPQMQASLNNRSQMRRELYDAIKFLQLSLHYQVQVDYNHKIEGVEALLRWQHPTQGMIAPEVFILLAEESDIILHLGAWVLETVCKQLKQWQADPAMAKLPIAINISTRQFKQPGFVNQVKEVLEKYGIDPARLKLELTESLLLTDVTDVVTKMVALRALGIQCSMDDFGAGYSSLSSMKYLPLQQLKIDKSFVQNITLNSDDAAIARTIIDMARHLELQVIAEGVETQDQVDLLRQFGCNSYQGFLYSQPLPLLAFEQFLQNSWATGLIIPG